MESSPWVVSRIRFLVQIVLEEALFFRFGYRKLQITTSGTDVMIKKGKQVHTYRKECVSKKPLIQNRIYGHIFVWIQVFFSRKMKIIKSFDQSLNLILNLYKNMNKVYIYE